MSFVRTKNDPQAREKLLLDMSATADAFPESPLAPMIVYWVANQYRSIDSSRAVAVYQRLIETYPDHDKTTEAYIEIGETYYDDERYSESKAAYERALKARPDRAELIRPQIARASRNVRRGQLMIVTCIVIAGIFATLLFLPPVGIVPTRKLGYGVFLMALFLAGGWLIREQFESTARLLALAAGFAASVVAPLPFVSKLSMSETVGGAALRIALSIALFACGFYLTVYLVNGHFLVVFGL